MSDDMLDINDVIEALESGIDLLDRETAAHMALTLASEPTFQQVPGLGSVFGGGQGVDPDLLPDDLIGGQQDSGPDAYMPGAGNDENGGGAGAYSGALAKMVSDHSARIERIEDMLDIEEGESEGIVVTTVEIPTDSPIQPGDRFSESFPVDELEEYIGSKVRSLRVGRSGAEGPIEEDLNDFRVYLEVDGQTRPEPPAYLSQLVSPTAVDKTRRHVFEEAADLQIEQSPSVEVIVEYDDRFSQERTPSGDGSQLAFVAGVGIEDV